MKLSKRKLNKLINKVLNEGKSELTILLESEDVDLFDSDTGEIDTGALDSLMKKASEGDRAAALQLAKASSVIVQKTGDKFNAFDGVKLDRESIIKAYGLDKPPPLPGAKKPQKDEEPQKDANQIMLDLKSKQDQLMADLKSKMKSLDDKATSRDRLRSKERELKDNEEFYSRLAKREANMFNRFIEDVKRRQTSSYFSEKDRAAKIAELEEKRRESIEELDDKYKETVEEINNYYSDLEKEEGVNSSEKINMSKVDNTKTGDDELKEGLSRGSLYRRRYYGRY